MKPLAFFVAALSLALGSLAFSQDKKAAPKKKPSSGAMAPVTDKEGLPRVLLIGDSISIGYTVGVRNLLKDKANVHRPRTNCGPTIKGVAEIEKWLETGGADKKWDLIHFNWGLHDLKYMGPNGENLADPKAATSKQQVPPEEYRKHLTALVAKLKATEAKLIWRNTTPVPEGCKGRVVGHSAEYNKIAAEIMKENDIPTQDLFAFTHEQHKAGHAIQRKADVHYSAAGSAALAKEVAELIEESLGK